MRIVMKVTPTDFEVSIRAVGQPKAVALVLELAEAASAKISSRLTTEPCEILKEQKAAISEQHELMKTAQKVEREHRTGGGS